MSGSRASIPDNELAQEWPFLTRQQLEEYKDAFRIFDRSGTGSFTAEDIGWVMRSLGQNPNEQQIDAIIRDMDLDNDGVIDLAEFMIRMMAFTTKAAPEEDLKHVFDVLDKSNEGVLTADSLRSAIKNIAEWEMTDDDIEVAIKLADKSGDGRIDYDEFIAFVFGGDEPGYQRQTSTKPVLTEQQPSQLPSQLPTAPAQAAAVAADMPPPAETDAQHPAETLTMSSNSWPQAQEELPPNQLPAPQLPSSGLDSMQAAVLAARQQSLTDAWVAAHTADLTPTDLTPADLTPANSAEAAPQAGTVYDNELYQEEAPSAPQAGAAYHVPVWELENPTTSSDLQMPAEQPGDDVRLDIQTDLATSDHMQPPQFEAQWAQQPAHSTALLGEDDPCAHEQISNATSCDTQWPYNVQGGSEPLQMPPAERASAALDAFGGGGTAQMRPIAQHGSEPGGLQAVVHGDAVHFNMPLEAHELAGGFPESSQPDSTAMHPAAQQASLQQHATKLSSGTKTPLKAPRKLPALSYAQLSQGVNRSQAKNQQLDRKS